MNHATGNFEVKMSSQGTTNAGFGHFTGDKQWHGAIAGTSKVEMWSAGDPNTGNAGYVALERVTAKLAGRSGSFTLQHSGILDAGKQQLTITVVPGSGTGELAGIGGTMTIDPRTHDYDFAYSLPK